jgi:D-xylose transport system permease protein
MSAESEATGEVPAAPLEPSGIASLPGRMLDNLRSGNLGSGPVIFALALIVLVFSQTADNFFSAVNFNNIILQMAGTTLLAYGVIFVLLIGEIDLSIAYVSGVAGVVVAQLQVPGSGHEYPGLIAVLAAIVVGTAIGAFQGSVVALIGVPSFVVTLAGYEIWQGVILKSIPQGVIVIQNQTVNDFSQYFFSDAAGWIIAVIVSIAYVAGTLSGVLQRRRHGVPIRDTTLLVGRLVGVPAAAFLTVAICNRDRGVPFPLLLIIALLLFWTYIAKRTTFGRHVYAVGGNAEAARRAGINVPRIKVIVFAISGAMAAVGGIVFAAQVNSIGLTFPPGNLLLNAIAAAVIGGVSLFGGRGEVRGALLGAILIGTLQNGLLLLNISNGWIYIVTGLVLLAAVTLDTVAVRLQARSGR